MVINLQVVEREGAHLFQTLKGAMRSHDLRTFKLSKSGRKVTHASPTVHGWMNWSSKMGVITCEILSPRKGDEWNLLSKFVGRLAGRYKDSVRSISIQFGDSGEAARRRPRR